MRSKLRAEKGSILRVAAPIAKSIKRKPSQIVGGLETVSVSAHSVWTTADVRYMAVDRPDALELERSLSVEVGSQRGALPRGYQPQQGSPERSSTPFDTPSGRALPLMYLKGCRSLRYRTGHGVRLLIPLSGGSRLATSTAPNRTSASSQMARVDGLYG